MDSVMSAARKYSRKVQQKIAIWYSDRERIAAEVEEQHALDVRRKTRLRLYECANATCCQKLRVASDTLQAEHVHVDPDTFEERRYPFILRTPVLVTSQTAPF